MGDSAVQASAADASGEAQHVRHSCALEAHSRTRRGHTKRTADEKLTAAQRLAPSL